MSDPESVSLNPLLEDRMVLDTLLQEGGSVRKLISPALPYHHRQQYFGCKHTLLQIVQESLLTRHQNIS